MASSGTWSVVIDDKIIIKKSGDMASDHTSYVINDDAFWNQSKFSNIWAIQYGSSITSDEVEYKDDTPHSSFADANLGNFQDFIDRWDAAHLAKLQADWDSNNPDEGWASDQAKIDALGPRPTSYSS